MPYSWVNFESEATFQHSDHMNVNYNKFSLVNYGLTFNLSKDHLSEDRSFSIGQRYERKGYNEITANFTWRLTPKWKFSIYERYNLKDSPVLRKGSQEQEYTLTRDLHCWDLDISLNQKEDTGRRYSLLLGLRLFLRMNSGLIRKWLRKIRAQ